MAVGTATVDFISLVETYPREDTEARALDFRICRGGNATNTLVVLSQLGHHCTFFCRWVPGRPPISCILLSLKSGSRTIVHYRDLPEYRFDDFKVIDLRLFDWIHCPVPISS